MTTHDKYKTRLGIILQRHKQELANFKREESDTLESMIESECSNLQGWLEVDASDILTAGCCIFKRPHDGIRVCRTIIFEERGVKFIDQKGIEYTFEETDMSYKNLACIYDYIKERMQVPA